MQATPPVKAVVGLNLSGGTMYLDTKLTIRLRSANCIGVLFLYAVVFVAVAMAGMLFDDYLAYQKQWALTLAGANPWDLSLGIERNAYGPAHNALALLYAIWPLAPKLLFALAGVFSVHMLHGAFRADDKITADRATLLLALSFALHPLITATFYRLSLNDGLCAALVLAALGATRLRRDTLAGIALGLATLIKFYPIFIAPFFMLRGGRTLSLHVMLVTVATAATGMGAGFLIWGEAVLTPFQFASERGAKLLSILHFFESFPAIIGGTENLAALLEANTKIILLVAIAAFAFILLIDASAVAGAALGFLAILTAYKVGHMQFYACWLALFAWLVAYPSNEAEKRLARALAPFVFWLGIVQVVYLSTDYMSEDFEFLRTYVSVPTFLLAAFCIVQGVRAIWRKPDWRLRLVWRAS